MARTSKYQNSTGTPTTPISLTKAGVYTRISVPDGDDVSESVTNQLQIATNYIDHSEDLEHVKTYTDDGYSGQDFNRPGFQEMVQDIKNGVINCVIVKDVSRIGRHHLRVGYLLESDFPDWGVRFISINENYDNVDDPEAFLSLRMILTNLMNQKTSEGTSRRVSSAINAKEQAGMFLPPSGSIPYGYVKDASNTTYLLDQETASVVELIYQLRTDGLNYTAIAKELNRRGIPCPGKLRFLRRQSTKESFKDAVWIHKTIREILSDQAYIGNRVHGKMKKDPRSGKKFYTDSSGWTVIKNAHPSIISEEVFYLVQEMADNEAQNRSTQKKRADAVIDHRELFKGLLFCADCDKPMMASKSCSREDSATASRIFYECSNYKNSERVRCSCHYVLDRDVYSALTEKLDKLYSEQADSGILQSQNSAHLTALKQTESKLDTLSKDKASHEDSFAKLYEQYAKGKLTRGRFTELAQPHRVALANLKEQMTPLLTTKQTLEQKIGLITNTMNALAQYQESKELTKELLSKLVKKITIDSGRHIHISFVV